MSAQPKSESDHRCVKDCDCPSGQVCVSGQCQNQGLSGGAIAAIVIVIIIIILIIIAIFWGAGSAWWGPGPTWWGPAPYGPGGPPVVAVPAGPGMMSGMPAGM